MSRSVRERTVERQIAGLRRLKSGGLIDAKELGEETVALTTLKVARAAATISISVQRHRSIEVLYRVV